jgi:hypothetical protein
LGFSLATEVFKEYLKVLHSSPTASRGCEKSMSHKKVRGEEL